MTIFKNFQTGQSVCTCANEKMVCGSDGTTYKTICSLTEESIKRGKPDKYNPELTVAYWGPCKERMKTTSDIKIRNDLKYKNLKISAPVIVSPPEDSYGPMGANLTLSCEARGFPAPVITWLFVSSQGQSISLPSK